MSDTQPEEEQQGFALKNEATIQRWELFHRAIAHAKESNMAALQERETSSSPSIAGSPQLTIAR